MVIKASASAKKEEATAARPSREESPLTLTFTVAEWRLLAVAAAKARPDAFISDGETRVKELKAMAKLIAEQTGNAPNDQ